jgi:hypothetical protein
MSSTDIKGRVDLWNFTKNDKMRVHKHRNVMKILSAKLHNAVMLHPRDTKHDYELALWIIENAPWVRHLFLDNLGFDGDMMDRLLRAERRKETPLRILSLTKNTTSHDNLVEAAQLMYERPLFTCFLSTDNHEYMCKEACLYSYPVSDPPYKRKSEAYDRLYTFIMEECVNNNSKKQYCTMNM